MKTASLPNVLPGMVVFFDQAACAARLAHALHPEGPRCPECGSAPGKGKNVARFMAWRHIACEVCGRRYSATTGTAFAGSRMSAPMICALLALLRLGLSSEVIGRETGLSSRTVRRWRRVFVATDAEGRAAGPNARAAGTS